MSSVIRALIEKRNIIADLKSEFENLKEKDFDLTSKRTGIYNCIAHAAHDPKHKWWPVPKEYAGNDVVWPDGAPRRRTIRAFTLAFQTLGYKPCENGDFEAGFEKVAIYVSDKATPENPLDAPTHMARQLPCGRWTSKLGGKEDIAHNGLKNVEGRIYGRIARYLKRPVLQILSLEKKEADNGGKTQTEE
jgi:hypothetical protein